ncbi:hypothetical protein GCM10009839_83300 [Catenulispora yoronensis]|uniref:Uncharacterized protein n=1 Tax=Catenulispora yoronensis TaxID=450799 RepID=A0ABP5GXL0_9ACTN
MTFTFGIYPGGAVGGDEGVVEPVRPDDAALIRQALDDLHGDPHGDLHGDPGSDPSSELHEDPPAFLVRSYLPFRPPAGSGERPVPAEPENLLGNGRKLELVLGYRDPDGDLEGWLAFVRAAVTAHGDRTALLQICEEPNADLPCLDGRTPGARRALVHGVVAAAEQARDLGLDLAVGFNAVPTFDADLGFWQDLAAIAAAEAPGFHAALGYVGFDFFPDVFRPIPPADLARAVTAVLTDFRERVLPAAGIGADVPIRIAENGWSTGGGRSEQRQAEVVQTVLTTVLGLSEPLAITGYSHFCLRDADSASSSLYYGFGLLRDDYTRKPAFAVYRRACRRQLV